MTENYLIYEKYYKILNWMLDRLEKYPKSVRYSVCSKIYDISIDIYDKIIESIYSKKRIYLLEQINISLEKLRLFMRLSYDRKYISLSQYEYIIFELEETGKMIGGWIKSEK